MGAHVEETSGPAAGRRIDEFAERMLSRRRSARPGLARPLPLPALLSQALVAFTVEFDNEFERQMPHRTTNHGATPGDRNAPWLVSLAMWANCMRFLPEAGATVSELRRLARTRTNLDGMRRWGYIRLEPGRSGGPRPKDDPLLRPTAAGRAAQDVWRPLSGVIEQRWRERFGGGETDRLRDALAAVAARLDASLPDCLPILGYGLFSLGGRPGDDRYPAELIGAERPGAERAGELPLWALLSRPLLAFAIEFERESDLSLAISADVLRALGDRAVPLRDLPRLTGVSKEAIAMAMGILRKSHLAVLEPVPAGGRGQAARLTPAGQAARGAGRRLLATIEERWQRRLGGTAVSALREPLEQLVGDPAAGPSPLFLGLEPDPAGWRSAIRRPAVLPHFPMVLHRGGFPDGS
jgi:hypothetical protein